MIVLFNWLCTIAGLRFRVSLDLEQDSLHGNPEDLLFKS